MIGQNDSNWAGYIVASDLQSPQPNVTSISAQWTVPTINSVVNDSFSAVWIGIGGFFDRSLIQVGSEQDAVGGQAQYSVWHEGLPGTSVTIPNITVAPGDTINASITLVNPDIDEWAIYIADLNGNQEFTQNFTYPSSQLSAEWILERPTAGRHSTTLANISAVTFNNCQATVASKTGGISDFPAVQSTMYQAVLDSTAITQLATVSNLTSNGSSFTATTYGQPIPELTVIVIVPLLIGLAAAIILKRLRKKLQRTSYVILSTRQAFVIAPEHQQIYLSIQKLENKSATRRIF